MGSFSEKGFTLIELLVVIAIIAILAVIVVLTLNPAQLLAQSRDSQRMSDMTTLNSAIGLYQTDQSTGSIGTSSVVYTSLPDASSTCGIQAPPTLPPGYAYACASPSNYRNASSSGWVPVNFQNISAGAPFGSTPVDPVNSTSSRLYYTYDTNGSQYEVTAAMESSKYKLGGSGDVISSDGGVLASVYEKGTAFGLEPLDYGDPTLAGYWPLNEGTSTVADDDSGNGNNGAWVGTQAGSFGYYNSGFNQAYSGYFNASNDKITVPTSTALNTIANDYTMSEWIYVTTPATSETLRVNNVTDLSISGVSSTQTQFRWQVPPSRFDTAPQYYPSGMWHQIVGTFSASSLKMSIYVDGALANTFTPASVSIGTSTPLYIPSINLLFNGMIEKVRVYDRALSGSEVQALYNAGK